MSGRIAGAAVLWALLSFAETALIGHLDAQETPAGIAIALLATLVFVAAAAAADARYGFRPSWLWLALIVVRNVVRDTFIVFGVLVRRLTGAQVHDRCIDIPFAAGGDDPASAARRALAVAGVSTAPNEIALTIDQKNGTMRLHALVVSGAKRHSAQWPL